MFVFRSLVRRTLFLTAVISCLGALTAAAAERGRLPASQLLPKETLAYLRIADVPELVERFQTTAMGQMLKDPQLAPLVGQLYTSAVEALAAVKEQTGASIDEIAAMFQGEVTVAVVANETGRPILVGLIDAGDRLPTARKLLDRGAELLEQRAALPRKS